MTLTRTIRRRNQRKARREKLARWEADPPIKFLASDWAVREGLRVAAKSLHIASLFNRKY